MFASSRDTTHVARADAPRATCSSFSFSETCRLDFSASLSLSGKVQLQAVNNQVAVKPGLAGVDTFSAFRARTNSSTVDPRTRGSAERGGEAGESVSVRGFVREQDNLDKLEKSRVINKQSRRVGLCL